MEPILDPELRQAHGLLDALPAENLNAVRSLLEVMVEPLGTLTGGRSSQRRRSHARHRRRARPRPCFTRSRRGNPARRSPPRIRPEAVNEDAAPEGIAVNWSPEARADLRAIVRDTAIQILDGIDRCLSNRTGDVKKLKPPKTGIPQRALACAFSISAIDNGIRRAGSVQTEKQ